MKEPTIVYVRWGSVRRDMKKMLEIKPSSKDDLEKQLWQDNVRFSVAELDSVVVGYIIFLELPTKLKLIDIVVANGMRRQGVGSQLIAHLINKLYRYRRNRIVTEVSELDQPTIDFLRAEPHQFRAVRVKREFFGEGSEDAFVMEHRLPCDPLQEEAACAEQED